MANVYKKHILITGLPGVGKTTIIKKLVEYFKNRSTNLNGFYTEEIREHGQRIGFDIVSVNGSRAILARKTISESPTDNRPLMVGSYYVHKNSFETLAISAFDNIKNLSKSIVIIDEIGKMEMFSKKFIERVRELFEDPSVIIVATLPLKTANIPLIQEIRCRQDVTEFTVTAQNRMGLTSEITLAMGQI